MSPHLAALLPFFLSVAETGSLSAASAIHAISQPALSRKIRQLEDGLGTQLFLRHARGMGLTQAGEVLLRRARLVRLETQRAVDEIGLVEGEAAGRITLTAGPAWALAILPGVLSEFHEAFPRYRVEMRVVSLSPSIEQVATGDVDIYLGGLDVTGCRRLGLEVVQPFNLDYLVFARPDHPLCAAAEIDVAALTRHDWSVYREDGAWDFFADIVQREAGAAPRVVMESTSLYATLEHAAASGCLVTMSRPVGGVARKLGLVPLPGQPVQFAFPTGFCHSPSAAEFPPLAHLIGLLNRHCETERDAWVAARDSPAGSG